MLTDIQQLLFYFLPYPTFFSFNTLRISTVPEALLSNRGIVVVPNESSSRSDFIQAIKKNVVLIVGTVD